MEPHGTFEIETGTEIKPVWAKDRPKSRIRSRVLRVLIWAALLLLFAGAFYLVFNHKEESKARPVPQITITTATAQKGNIGDYLEAIGTVTPVYTASIFSQVTGVVFAVNYQEGQIVKKGDRLTDIDDRQYVANAFAGAGGARTRREPAGTSADGP